MTWVVISLTAAVCVGMVGSVYLTTPLNGTNSETVFLVMTDHYLVHSGLVSYFPLYLQLS